MSLFKKLGVLIGLHSPAQRPAVHETSTPTDVQKAIAALRTTPIGDVIAAQIRSLAKSPLAGIEKFERVVAATLPHLTAFTVLSGTAVTARGVEDFARALVQEIYNDIASPHAPATAGLILRALGLERPPIWRALPPSRAAARRAALATARRSRRMPWAI